MATADDKKVIFSMVGVSKNIRQTGKQVLKNIYLSFFYGANYGTENRHHRLERLG